MYFVLVAALLCGGAALSRWAVSRPALTAQLERAGGVALIAGFVLLGFALPVSRHFNRDHAGHALDGGGTSLVKQAVAAGIAGSFQDADAGVRWVFHPEPGRVGTAAGGQAVGDRRSTFPLS